MPTGTTIGLRAAGRVLGKLAIALLATASHAEKPADIETIAAEISKSVGTIQRASPGHSGAAIVVFEERHDSILGQLQEAVMLDRLVRDHSFEDLGLEGYLADQEARLGQPGRGLRPENAVQLLERGEISGAEFMALTNSMTVHPIEVSVDYVRPEQEAMVSPLAALIGIAVKWLERESNSGALDAETRSRVSELEKRLASAPEAERARLIGEFQLSLVEHDPWTRGMSKRLKQECGAAKPIAKEIHDLREISRKAEEVGAELPQAYREGLQSLLHFYRAREASSKTMVERILEIEAPSGGGVAMVIGAAHTDRVGELLANSGRPFAIIAPNALYACDEAEETDFEAYGRILEGRPVEEGILEEALLAVYPPRLIKPQPLSIQRWFKARTEFVSIAEGFVRAVAAGGGGDAAIPPKTALSAAGGGDRWRGRFTRVDTTRAVIALDEKSDQRFLVFPMEIASSSGTPSREVWVRAGLGTAGEAVPPAISASNKEKLLMDAIDRVEGRAEAKRGAAEAQARSGRKSGLQTIEMLGSRPIEVSSSRAKAMQGLVAI